MSQYDEIRKALKRYPKNGRTALELMQATGSTCPWKRISEMQERGELIFAFDRPLKDGKTVRAWRMPA